MVVIFDELASILEVLSLRAPNIQHFLLQGQIGQLPGCLCRLLKMYNKVINKFGYKNQASHDFSIPIA